MLPGPAPIARLFLCPGQMGGMKYGYARTSTDAAQRRGVKFGRKVKLMPAPIDYIRKLINRGEARHYVADLLNLTRHALSDGCEWKRI